jgi:hypothetical protein
MRLSFLNNHLRNWTEARFSILNYVVSVQFFSPLMQLFSGRYYEPDVVGAHGTDLN